MSSSKEISLRRSRSAAPNIRGRRRRRPPIPTCGGGGEPGVPAEPGADGQRARGAADGGGLRGAAAAAAADPGTR